MIYHGNHSHSPWDRHIPQCSTLVWPMAPQTLTPKGHEIKYFLKYMFDCTCRRQVFNARCSIIKISLWADAHSKRASGLIWSLRRSRKWICCQWIACVAIAFISILALTFIATSIGVVNALRIGGAIVQNRTVSIYVNNVPSLAYKH